ncbi:MAG: peptide chain release factor 3 [Magnetococcales bacterium]|nr:peptide chain release factor 3 [Magnetococcales bacterium]MBF0151488.1 peptide chain release factor 3 [Magnetococcales bacterium]MBF0175089.1 peptide chain release factor 3 [Magnetococcales bacterium]MBF0632452.1 peptide chain release factor 3 [Magnetococcales bacterium]
MKDHPSSYDNRRTFAIIAHPDAGKTTLTEKLLLFAGAIQMAGRVKARGQARRARSDWMKVERERGISVTASVMTFEHEGNVFNLLDTPGHEDFSEDTYRTLTAVDTAVMVLDAAKGIEAQTLKLFEVCRLRNVPIITFINKMDRDGRSPFELLDEIENQLALEVTPASWPIGMGREFLGCYDLLHDQLMFMKRGDGSELREVIPCQGLDDPVLGTLLSEQTWATMREEVLMTRELCPTFNTRSFLRGDLSPVFFGSAVNNFGVRELLWGLATMASPPRPQTARERWVDPGEDKVTGFVFKIQANMDLKHRDRIAFIRLCSGHFKRGMKLVHQRTGKSLNVHNPMIFLARERETAEEARAGDIIGIPNHGVLRIGDTLTEGETLKFTGVPSFAPELLRRIRPDDPMRTKHLGKTLIQLGEEGAARVFKTRIGSDWVVGVLGALQFEVLADRIRTEYEMVVHFESTPFFTARWVDGDDPAKIRAFTEANALDMAEDHDGLPVYMARNAWRLENAAREWPQLRFLATREQI